MPVRSISSCCSLAIQSLPPRCALRSSSRSVLEAVADHAAFLHGEWRFIHDGAGDQLDQVGGFGELRCRASASRLVGRASARAVGVCSASTIRLAVTLAPPSRSVCSQRRNLFQRLRKATRSRALPLPVLRRPKRAFQIADLGELCAEAVQAGCVFDERLHGFLTLANRFDGGERLRKPVAQQPRAHRRDGAVQRAVERGVARSVVMQRFEDFQMPQRRVIEREKIACVDRTRGA